MTAPPKKRIVAASLPPAYVPISPEPADFHAIQALIRCDASPEQQRRFRQWFDRVTAVNEDPFRPGSEGARETDYACGKAFVARQFYAIANTLAPRHSSEEPR